MASRRGLLAGSLASLLPWPAPAQDGGELRRRLAQLMAEHRVPAVSAAVIRGGEIAERMAVACNDQTLFQAASISKVVAGVTVLRLVERQQLGLDRPVNEALRAWSLPGEFAGKVTPRLLLSHRAGTTVPGFPGYTTGARLPTLLQTLDGAPPANTPPVQAKWPPGQAFRYSGGGTMVLQLLAGEVAGTPFERLASASVLDPAGMKRSTFGLLSAAEPNVASAHDVDGQPLPGRFRSYPEQAAAGLWSTADDLAHLALAIAGSWRDGGLLVRQTAQALATPVGNGPTGLGVFVQQRPGKAPYLYHYGVNAGFRSLLVFAADGAFGLTLMTNGEGGRRLIPAFHASVFAAFGQDEFKPPP